MTHNNDHDALTRRTQIVSVRFHPDEVSRLRKVTTNLSRFLRTAALVACGVEPSEDVPTGCDGFPVWKTDGKWRYMRCGCGSTATATSDASERSNRQAHYSVMRELERHNLDYGENQAVESGD